MDRVTADEFTKARDEVARAKALERRNAAFRLAFRRCGGILPRPPGARPEQLR
jgi:hypothetical protein